MLLNLNGGFTKLSIIPKASDRETIQFVVVEPVRLPGGVPEVPAP